VNVAVSTEETLRFGGRFTEWTPLARGAEGRLFRVRDRWTGHVAALKIAESPSARESLVAEHRLLGSLAHPCLVESRDLVRDEDDVAHLLEFVPAVPAERLWEEGGEAAVWAALTQSLRGLAYLHRRGFVHGDVAPGNLLVWREGERWRAKVADLGLTLSMADARVAGVRGTPGYMAPETGRGDGAGPAADLFSLAVTAVTWIDGGHPLEGASPAEMMRRLVSGEFVPSPRRVVSRELFDLIALLGNLDPAVRGFGGWEDLRARAEAWGPAIARGGVHGLDGQLAEWRGWLRDLTIGRAAGIVVRGRVGSGRRTLCRAMVRALVAEGWAALAEEPLESVRDRLATSPGDPDPVTLARELVERFSGRDAVVPWPERAGDLESRLLRAFVVSREEEGSGSRTCVLKASSAAEDDSDGAWIVATTRSIVATWPGPDVAALRSLRDDLFPEEEGYGVAKERPEVAAGASPLSLVRLKQVGAGSGADLTDEAMSAEVVKTWSHAGGAARDVLALLAWSERGWRWASLGRALGMEGATLREVQQEMETLGLSQRDHERGELQERMADRLVRSALVEVGEGQLSDACLADICRYLETDADAHPGDLALAGAMVRHGRLPMRYLADALSAAIGDGRFEAVIGFWARAAEDGNLDAAHHRFVWDAALRAVQRLGRFPEEVRILEDLLEALPDAAEAVEWRKMLATSRFAVGDWQRAVSECDALVALTENSASDRMWARLQKAEFLWQTGHFEEADEVYGTLDPEKLPSKELLLRYFVGRARESAQQLDHGNARVLLTEAETALGSEICQQDLLFLHASAGVMLETGEQLVGVGVASKAVQLAESTHAWDQYAKVASRAGALAFESGRVRYAHRLGTRALSVAVVLGSERMAALAGSFLGSYEVILGSPGSALSRRDFLLHIGRELDDGLLIEAHHRLGLYLGSLVGLRSLAEASAEAMAKFSSMHYAPYIAESLGLLELGSENWESARDQFAQAANGYRSLSRWDSEAACQAYGVLADVKMGCRVAAAEKCRAARAFFDQGKYPFFHPRMLLIGCEAGPETTSPGVDEAFSELQAEGRAVDLVMWAPLLTQHCSPEGQVEVRKSILAAVKQIADSLESATLRKEFLSYPRTRTALLAVQGA
jgi:tetratricopeptide (TPR) repeat protein